MIKQGVVKIKHRDFEITSTPISPSFVAVHEYYSVVSDGAGGWIGSHPVIVGESVNDCIKQINEWYKENEVD